MLFIAGHAIALETILDKMLTSLKPCMAVAYDENCRGYRRVKLVCMSTDGSQMCD